MAIFRTEHKKNYTTVNNFICTDKRLSWKAKGIWLYAFSRPDDWDFYLSDIIKQSNDGRDAVKTGLQELEKYGYLVRTQGKNEKGQFDTGEFTFYEKPQSDHEIPEVKKKKKSDKPYAENPSTVSPTTDNPPLLSTDVLLDTEGNASNAPMPLKKGFNESLDPIQQENYNLMKAQDLGATHGTLAYLARKYTKQEVTDAVFHLKREIENGTQFKKEKIAFFRFILAGKVSKITPQASTNKKWAENAKHGMPWPALEIHEKYVKCTNCLKEIPFDLPQDEFGRLMDDLWQTSKKYN